ncbi:MAG: F0F1 ATP synthase subunit delta [Candidatus Uhrbacteria bacterium]|nr:F0F1 ATP synthase subunit delta [Candidatus Uhrbacteria bacterium]
MKIATLWLDDVARAFLAEIPSVEAQDEALSKLERLERVFQHDARMRDEFLNASHPLPTRARSLQRVLEKYDFSSTVIHLILLFMHEQKLSQLDVFIARLKKMRDELGLARQVDLLSAESFSEAARQKLHDVLEKKWKTHVRLEERTDPTLLGGFELRTDGWHFDASIKGKFQRLKMALIAETL